jgi:hypothetical protein
MISITKEIGVQASEWFTVRLTPLAQNQAPVVSEVQTLLT